MSTSHKRHFNTYHDNLPKRGRFEPDIVEQIAVIPHFYTEAQLQLEVARQMANQRDDYERRVKAIQSDYMQRVQAMEEELAVITVQWTEKPHGDYIS